MKRTPSPTEEDYERIAETLGSLYSDEELADDEEFEKTYTDYFEDNYLATRKDVQDKVHRVILETNETIKDKRDDIRRLRAEGKLPSKRLQKKELVAVPIEQPPKRFPYTGRIGQKIVYVRPMIITRNKKEVTVFRDKTGRFAKSDFKIQAA